MLSEVLCFQRYDPVKPLFAELGEEINFTSHNFELYGHGFSILGQDVHSLTSLLLSECLRLYYQII